MARHTSRTALGLAFIAAVAILEAACSNKPPDDPADYAKRIAAIRAAKDEQFMREDDPVPASRKAEFLPLAYFPIDPDYHVLAALKPIDDRTPHTLFVRDPDGHRVALSVYEL